MIDRLETIDAAEQCGFSAAGRSEQDDNLALPYVEIDPPKDLELAERFMQIFN